MSDKVEQKPEQQEVIDPLAEVKAKLTDAEKEQFFKSFLADTPYEGIEYLFGGKLKVKFSSLNIKQNNAVMRQMDYDRKTKKAQDTDAYFIRVIQYRLAAALCELDDKPFGKDLTVATPDDEAKGETYIAQRVELMNSWPVYKVSSLTDAFNRFEKKLLALTQESFKENF